MDFQASGVLVRCHNTPYFVSVYLKAQFHSYWYQRMISFLSLSEQLADLCRLRAATVPLKAAEALDIPTLSNIS